MTEWVFRIDGMVGAQSGVDLGGVQALSSENVPATSTA